MCLLTLSRKHNIISMNRISEITRRNIFDFVQIEGFSFNGRLEESDFLSRVFNLNEIRSNDSRFDNAWGDIWQHRVNNPNDWDDNWIYQDSRFNLLGCDDVILLQYLCETVPPLVRLDSSHVAKLVQIFYDNLRNDGFEIIEKARVSNKPIFAGRLKITVLEH